MLGVSRGCFPDKNGVRMVVLMGWPVDMLWGCIGMGGLGVLGLGETYKWVRGPFLRGCNDRRDIGDSADHSVDFGSSEDVVAFGVRSP